MDRASSPETEGPSTPPPTPRPSGCSWAFLVFLSTSPGSASGASFLELVMSYQAWVFFPPILPLKPPLSFPPELPLSPQCLPGPGLRLPALSSLMNWTPWPQAGGEVETLEV